LAATDVDLTLNFADRAVGVICAPSSSRNNADGPPNSYIEPPLVGSSGDWPSRYLNHYKFEQ